MIAQVKTLPRGHTVGYGRTLVTSEEVRIAVIPVGYADGFRRAPNHWGEVLVHGQRAPIAAEDPGVAILEEAKTLDAAGDVVKAHETIAQIDESSAALKDPAVAEIEGKWADKLFKEADEAGDDTEKKVQLLWKIATTPTVDETRRRKASALLKEVGVDVPEDPKERGKSDLVAYLLERGAKTSFQFFIAIGDLAKVQAMVKAEPGIVKQVVNPKSVLDATPLHTSVDYGQVEIAKYLINQGANVNYSVGPTPLHTAAWADRPEIAELLIGRGAKLEVRQYSRTCWSFSSKSW